MAILFLRSPKFCIGITAEVVNNRENRSPIFVSQVLSYNVRDDAETSADTKLPNEIIARFTPRVWAEVTNLFLASFNWTQCALILSQNEVPIASA